MAALDQIDAPTPTLEGEIAALLNLSLDQLRLEWTKRFEEPAPHFRTQDLMARALAHRLQVRAFGDVAGATKRTLKRASKAQDAGASPTAARPVLNPGAVLVKVWNGTRHEVEVMETGRFAYRGERYRSLSEIARKITGVHWSGPRFFGLDRVR